MTDKYDCFHDVTEHQFKVRHWLFNFVDQLIIRANQHDESKLEEPEKSMYDEWTPNLKRVEFGSSEYKYALEQMGTALKHHYENNRHHPEHYGNGINGMTLIDVVEMFADWLAAAKNGVNLDYLSERFGISEQLKDILANTLREFGDRDKSL